ncbi:MAG: hypothetical protein AB1483_06620 [Candidatus Zixiibacteriota bacterium]
MFRRSKLFAIILNLLLPGLGHIYWREYLFGIFVFLIMLIASLLFFVSFFLSVSLWVWLLMMALPILFYLFTFIDLVRAVGVKRDKLKPGKKSAVIFLAVGIAYQLLSPSAPVNFGLQNFPDVFVLKDTSLSPIHSEGALLKASRLAYSVDFVFLRKPVLYALPERYDIVRFRGADGGKLNGIVLGLPTEEVEMADGVLVVNGLPDFREPAHGMVLQGDCQLTYVSSYSILVATLNLGRVDTVYMVPLTDVVGEVSKVI